MKNRFIKVYRIFALILSLSCFAMLFVGCSGDKDKKKKGETYIYYVNKQGTKVESKEYEIKQESKDGQIDELIEQLQLNSENIELVNAIPDDVKIQGYALEDDVLTISFTSAYDKLSKSREVLLRAAVVLTMTQLECISQVSFNVLGEPLKLSSGEVLGNMQASDFADNLDSNKQVYNTGNFSIYFANQTGNRLVKYDFEAEYGSDMSKEQFVINKLIQGPEEEEGYSRTLPGNVTVVNVSTVDNICYVTFGENFLTEAVSVPDELVIYSIVNSLSEISHIQKVQISVEGQSEVVYHGKISLSQPFVRNLDYVEKAETATE